ncbi:hypothetical protein KKC13_05090 [bacterium]|nr:hypothetical protein [bacterium]MBU1959406.1 hypothetical protein [bacterium]
MANLELKVLSKREETNNGNTSICYICEGTLENYIKSIPDRYREYDIQRGIVKNNVYLERLTTTILEKKHIPSIVLVSMQPLEDIDKALILQEYKILDGLQRSYRMKLVYNAYQLYLEKIDKGSKEEIENKTKFKLSQELKNELKEKATDISYFWTILDFYRDRDVDRNVFQDFIQWFEVWDNLDKNEQINKMLLLNAGHKSMDMKHQLELLFLNIISDDYLKNFIRSKDINATYFYKNKNKGDLHLAHTISALIAFDKCEPILLNQKFLQELHENIDVELEQVKVFFMDNNLEKFINFSKQLDELIDNEYGKTGLEWIGRESVLIGMFAAFGKYFKIKYDKNIESLDNCFSDILEIISNNIESLKIDEFNMAKENVNIAKVNIGDLFKYSTYYYFCQILKNNQINKDWKMIFKISKGDIKNECS